MVLWVSGELLRASQSAVGWINGSVSESWLDASLRCTRCSLSPSSRFQWHWELEGSTELDVPGGSHTWLAVDSGCQVGAELKLLISAYMWALHMVWAGRLKVVL